jgi:hypothetical protein
MNLQQIIEALQLTVLTEARDFTETSPTGGYVSDLLSCVMAGAAKNDLWVTLQAHMNIVAVASMLEVAAIIITENAQPDAETISKANEEGVILLATTRNSYEVCGMLWEMDIPA